MLSTDLTLTPDQASLILSRWLGRNVPCTAIERLTGGMINSALKLRFDGEPGSAVVKLTTDPAGPGLRSEKTRLDHLAAHSRLRVPRAYAFSPADEQIPFSYLLLETIPGVNMTSADLSPADRRRIETQLADALIELHSHTRETFGRVDEPGSSLWSDVFVPSLIGNRGHVQDRLPADVLDDIDAAIDAAPAALADQGTPTLIHEDLWAGNIMVDRRDNGWHLSGLVDPSGSKYADVECELAYLQVFDTVGSAFFERYTVHHPLRDGYEVRRLLYWLDTYMIHVWLFGDRHYCERTEETARAILSVLP